MTSPLNRVSLADQAVDALIRLIEERQLKADDALPSTAELADVLDVSRTVVREAIAELAGQGVLSRRQGRETLVAMPDERQLERLLRLRFAVGGADYEGLQQFRHIIELGAARLAAEHATDEDIAILTERLKDLQQATGDEELHNADQAFHREIARVSRNEMTLLTIEGIAPLLVQLRRHVWAGWLKAGKGAERNVDLHEAILERIIAHDPDGAAEAMRTHLDQAAEALHRDRGSASGGR